jgi:hypothetical protein
MVMALASGVVLALAVVGPAAAVHGRSVPFSMDIVGLDEPLNGDPFTWDTFDGRCSVPSNWVTTINSAGTAAHMGDVTVVQSHCTIIHIVPPPPFAAQFADGTMTVTGADGDELWLEYHGGFSFMPTGETSGLSDLTYIATIHGGTGRFVGATGDVMGRAIDNWPEGPNTAHFTGTIKYDPSVQAGG